MSSSYAVQQGECLTGFRFKPKDPELIKYLYDYIYHKRRPDGIFHEENIYNYHPDILGSKFEHGIEGKMYFFTPTRKMQQGGQKIGRLVEGGPAFWKNTNKGEDVQCPNGIVGKKNPFSFREGPKQKSIGWIMQEYRLKDVRGHAENLNQKKMDDFALCIIYNESRGSSNPSGAIIDGSNQPHGEFNMDYYDELDCNWERHLQDY